MTEYNLIKYIKSTFNYTVNIDAYNFKETACLTLLQKSKYNVCIMPIKIPEYTEKYDFYSDLTMKAFNTWSDAIHNKISFSMVNEEGNADIKVYFTASTTTKLGKQYQEQLIIGATDNMLVRVKGKLCIVIGIRDVLGEKDKQKAKFDEDKIYHILLHEIGHIFCLGHSLDKNDVMTKTSNFPTKLSENDIFVLRLIYHIGDGKSYKDMQNYIETVVHNFETYKNKKNTKHKKSLTQNFDKNKFINNTSAPKNLMNDLASISELKKYKMIIDNIKIPKFE